MQAAQAVLPSPEGGAQPKGKANLMGLTAGAA